MIDKNGNATFSTNLKVLQINYEASVKETKRILSMMKEYVTNNDQFKGYKGFDDDEPGALTDLVTPYFQKTIQPLVLKYYNKYIKPHYGNLWFDKSSLKINYDLEYASENSSVNIEDSKFRKLFQNYLILQANSSNTALNHPTTSAAYFNYAGNQSSYTIPSIFYYNYNRSVYYWGTNMGRNYMQVDSDF